MTANRRSISATGINPLNCVFELLDRHGERPNRPTQRPNRDVPARLEHTRQTLKAGIKMKKFGFAAIAASGLAAAILGLAAPAQAATGVDAPTAPASAILLPTTIDHHRWIHDIQPQVIVPQVDTSVRQSR
jgi:hypothetical protein